MRHFDVLVDNALKQSYRYPIRQLDGISAVCCINFITGQYDDVFGDNMEQLLLT
jgi:hypothetical protein